MNLHKLTDSAHPVYGAVENNLKALYFENNLCFCLSVLVRLSVSLKINITALSLSLSLSLSL